MTDLAPSTQYSSAAIQPVATVGNSLLTIAAVAQAAGTVTAVTYYPGSTRAGANTNSRTLNLYNRNNSTGAGTTLVATLALVSGVDLTDNVAKVIALSGTPANLVVAAGDVLEFESLAVGTGIADPGGVLVTQIARS